MIRDDVDVPPIMLKCCEVIERYGLQSQGIYRISGTMSKITKLKELLDRGMLNFTHFINSNMPHFWPKKG